MKTLALRTSKADCFVGLKSDKEIDEIQKRGGDDWTRTGKYVIVTILKRLMDRLL